MEGFEEGERKIVRQKGNRLVVTMARSQIVYRQLLPLIQPKRLVLTHMSEDLLNRLDSVSYEMANDGKIINL